MVSPQLRGPPGSTAEAEPTSGTGRASGSHPAAQWGDGITWTSSVGAAGLYLTSWMGWGTGRVRSRVLDNPGRSKAL